MADTGTWTVRLTIYYPSEFITFTHIEMREPYDGFASDFLPLAELPWFVGSLRADSRAKASEATTDDLRIRTGAAVGVTIGSGVYDEAYDVDEDGQCSNAGDDMARERDERVQELEEDGESDARSDDSGWFYDD